MDEERQQLPQKIEVGEIMRMAGQMSLFSANGGTIMAKLGEIMRMAGQMSQGAPWFFCQLDDRTCVFFPGHVEREELKLGARQWSLGDGTKPAASGRPKKFSMTGNWYFIEEMEAAYIQYIKSIGKK